MKVRKECATEGCSNVSSNNKAGGICKSHFYGRCVTEGCSRLANGPAGLCKSHFYGRCVTEGCNSWSAGPAGLCNSHTYGHCVTEGCSGWSAGPAGLCKNHRYGHCVTEGCSGWADGPAGYCQSHSPGVRIQGAKLAEHVIEMATAGVITTGAAFKGVKSPWHGTCATCGLCISPRLSSIRDGQGACRHCANRRRIDTRLMSADAANVRGNLYLMSIETPDWSVAKVGIAKDVDRRRIQIERAVTKATGTWCEVSVATAWPCWLSTSGLVEHQLLNGPLLQRDYRVPEVEQLGWAGSSEVFPLDRLHEVSVLIDAFNIKPPDEQGSVREALEHLEQLQRYQAHSAYLREA